MLYTYRYWIYIETRNKVYIESCDVIRNVNPSSTELQKDSKRTKSVKGFKMSESKMCMLEIQTHANRFTLKKRGLSKNNFEKLLIEVVDEGLSSLGDSGKEAFYFCLRSCFSIEKHRIPYNIEAFAKALEEIFGVGAKLIEIKIIEALHQRVNQFKYFPNQGDLVFTEYLAALRRFL